MADEQRAESVPRRPGRPRKWANDAERARAYRARRASELADSDALRRELRALRSDVRRLAGDLEYEQARRVGVERVRDRLVRQLERVSAALDQEGALRQRAEHRVGELLAERGRHADGVEPRLPVPAPDEPLARGPIGGEPPMAAGNRAARRRAARAKRRRS